MENQPKAVTGVLLFFRRKNIATGSNDYLFRHTTSAGYVGGLYNVPGGHCKESETYLEAARREAKSEFGVTVDMGENNVAHVICHKLKGQVRTDVCLLFDDWNVSLKNSEHEKSGK